MVKIIGIALIITSAAAYGFAMSGDLKRHLNELLEIKKIMFLLRSEIEYGMCPIKEAFGEISARCKDTFGTVLNGLAKDDSGDFKEQWENEWTKGFKSMLLTEDEQGELLALKDVVVLNDKDAEIRQIDLYLSGLECRINELRETIPKKSRVYKCVSIGTGVFLSIIIM